MTRAGVKGKQQVPRRMVKGEGEGGQGGAARAVNRLRGWSGEKGIVPEGVRRRTPREG